MEEIRKQLGEFSPEEIELAIASIKLYRINKHLKNRTR